MPPLLRIFLTPPSRGHLPYILHCKTQGRRVILSCVSYLFFSPYCWATPRNTMGHGREEVQNTIPIVSHQSISVLREEGEYPALHRYKKEKKSIFHHSEIYR